MIPAKNGNDPHGWVVSENPLANNLHPIATSRKRRSTECILCATEGDKVPSLETQAAIYDPWLPEFRETRIDLARQRFHPLAVKHDSLAEIAVVDGSVTVPGHFSRKTTSTARKRGLLIF